MPKNIKDNLNIKPTKWIDQVIEIALERVPELRPEPESEAAKKPVAEQSGDSVITH